MVELVTNNEVLSILVLVTLLLILLIIMTVVTCISVALHSFYFIKEAIIVATESSHLQTPYELVGDCELTKDEGD